VSPAVAALARPACVSRTFLYQNQQARALIEQVTRTSRPQPGISSSRNRTQPAWRERALNAEDALTQTQREIRAQRTRIAELLGEIRDLEHDLPEGSLQRIVTENTTLKQHVRQLTQDNQRLQERLASARQNNRFLDKHIADLEAQLAPSLTTPPPLLDGVGRAERRRRALSLWNEGMRNRHKHEVELAAETPALTHGT
jgi:chromosome segregation ATPase